VVFSTAKNSSAHSPRKGRFVMAKMKAGITGFIPKDADFYETLKSYAKMGYHAFESAGYLFRQGDPVENAKRVRDMGLEIITMGANLRDGNKPDTPKLIKDCKLVGVDRVTFYHSSAASYRFADRPDLPKWPEMKEEIATVNQLGKDLAREGISLVFHNHDPEFTTIYQGVPLFWLLAANCEDLKFEVDLAWAHYAGWDPAKLISTLGDRVVSLHVKDYIPGDNFEYKSRTVTVPRYCAPGAGVVDLFACFRAAEKIGVKWAIIEQDMLYLLSYAESVQAAYYNMKETGFVE
jgi:sugar phosphate isomerase/epimerase